MTMTATTMTDLDITEYRLRFERPLTPGEATHLRGFAGSAFPEEELVHHHRRDGSLMYKYPRVQFKVIDRTARLIGLADGGVVVERLWRELDQFRLDHEELPILEATLLRRREPLGECAELVEYRFVNPWLALNQDNHARYAAARSDAEQQAVLERVLVGNCLSMAKSFGHQVAARLLADAGQLRPVPVRLKRVPMLGFRGTFQVNFRLPAWVGIGKSVSRGFGTVESMVANGQS